MANFRDVDVERVMKMHMYKNAREDIFYNKYCHDCYYSEYCHDYYYSEYCKKSMNCFVCELFKQSRPGSNKGLCVCLNVPTVKEKELGKCKYFKPREEQTDGTESI